MRYSQFHIADAQGPVDRYDLAEGLVLIPASARCLPCDSGEDGHRCALVIIFTEATRRPIDKRRTGGAEDAVSSMKSVKLAPTL